MNYNGTDEVIGDDENSSENANSMDKRRAGESFTTSDRNSSHGSLKAVTPIRFSVNPGQSSDRNIVAYHLYNSFNYSLFAPSGNKNVKVSLGITSPNQGEGKTTTVCNLATAISLGAGRRTVVVDFNLTRPRIHEIFGTQRSPGLAEALTSNNICVTPTQTKNLFALPVGDLRIVSPSSLANFRDVLPWLFTEFDFVIVDMPSVNSKSFPTLIANQLNGLIVVVESGSTKRRDVNKLFRKIREKDVVGFVMNKVEETDL
ncbi:MAG: CpsD/CapB family tyrosine-protein kinase [Candidatus Kryptoniota bacterium]